MEKIDQQRQKAIENFECKIEDNYNDTGKNIVVERKITNVNNEIESGKDVYKRQSLILLGFRQ